MQTKFEKLIEYVVANDEKRARSLFHQIVIDKSRKIYEALDMDNTERAFDDVEADHSASDQHFDEFGGDESDDLETDVFDDTDSDGLGDMGDETGELNPEIDDRVADLEQEFDALKAEFEELLHSEEGEGEEELEGLDDEEEGLEGLESAVDDEEGEEEHIENDTPTPMIGGLELLKQINIRNSAALISADNNVYLGDEHYLLRRYFRSVGINPELQTGVVRIRFEGTEGFYNTTIEFAKKDTETIQRVFTALDYVAAPNGTYVVEYTMSNVRKDFRGTSEEIKKEIEKWLNPVAPSYSSNMNYWRTQESKKSLGRLLDEAKQKRELTKRLQEEFGKFV
jgi:hypothetical protein